MFKFRVHWTKDGIEDSLAVEADTIEDIQTGIEKELALRGIDKIEHKVWSETLPEQVEL